MVAKLAVVIVAVGVTACALLAVRQMRTQAAHELSEARLRIMQRDNQLWRVRARIAEAVAPQRVHALAAGLNAMQPLRPELAAKPVPPEFADIVLDEVTGLPVVPRVAGAPQQGQE